MTRTRSHDSGFFQALTQNAEYDPAQKKRERTLARLRLATANCLEQNGYIGLTANDISEEAELSEGSFYVYFKDKREAAASVLLDYLEFSIGEPESKPQTKNAFEAIRETNRVWIKNAMEHPGLTRSVFQLVDSDPDFAAAYADYNRHWHEKVAKSVKRRRGKTTKADSTDVLFEIASLGAMMDEIVRGIFSNGAYAHLLNLVEEDEDGQGLADALSVIWFRVLYPGLDVPNT